MSMQEATITPLDGYLSDRNRLERHLELLISYREHCAILASAAAAELAAVETAIGELETLMQLKQQPEGRV